MESQKIYVSGNPEGSSSVPWWSNLMNNNDGFGGGNGWWLIFLLLLFGRNGLGNVDPGMLSSSGVAHGTDILMQALQGNKDAIDNLASTLHCDVNAIQSALCALQSKLQENAYQTELAGQKVSADIKDCCCDVKGILNEGFSTLGYAFRDQTCDLEKAINASTAQIIAGQKDAEMREIQRELATLREEKQKYEFSSMLGAYINPIAQEVASIKCKLPKTETIPVSNDYVRIDRSIAAPFCGCGFNFGNGFGLGTGLGFPFPNGGGFFG